MRGKDIHTDEKSIDKITSDPVQLSFYRDGIWDVNDQCRVCLVISAVDQPDRLHGGVSVCACNAA